LGVDGAAGQRRSELEEFANYSQRQKMPPPHLPAKRTQQRDLMPVLRRPVQPADQKRTGSPASHRSRASFRRPQRADLSDEQRSTFRFNARMTPIRAGISGPRSSAALINTSAATYRSGTACFAFDSAMM